VSAAGAEHEICFVPDDWIDENRHAFRILAEIGIEEEEHVRIHVAEPGSTLAPASVASAAVPSVEPLSAMITALAGYGTRRISVTIVPTSFRAGTITATRGRLAMCGTRCRVSSGTRHAIASAKQVRSTRVERTAFAESRATAQT
jgi:hypothetical protein